MKGWYFMVTTKEMVIKNIISAMAVGLQQLQLAKLENTLRIALHNINLVEESTELSTYTDDNDYVLRTFAASKKLEGASMKTIEQYVRTTRTMLNTIDKNYKDVSTADIKVYLAMYQQQRAVCQNTIANTKRFLSAFFGWAEDEEYIAKNPVRAIKNIKQIQKEKSFLTEDEIEKMRAVKKSTREKAIFEFLLSTGCRVSEAVALNRSDIDLEKGTVRIYASKTRKYRTGYLTASAKLHLRNYLFERNDCNKALFVENRRPNRRLGNKSMQTEVQNIASRAAVEKHVTVHLFRKTLATRLASRGVDIVIIKEILGHADISVTVKNYVSYSEESIRIAHGKIA